MNDEAAAHEIKIGLRALLSIKITKYLPAAGNSCWIIRN